MLEDVSKLASAHEANLPGMPTLIRDRYYEAASLLYSAKAICLDSPVLLAHLHHTLPSSVFNEIRSLELVFCSNHAAPIAELNAQTIATFKTILKGMPNVSRLLILLPYQCWRDFFYESPSAPPARRLEASQQWEREHAFYGRDFNAYGWPDVEPYLDWLKEFQCDIDVTVSMFERRPGISGVATASDVLRAEKMLRVRRRLEAGSFLLVE
ncbi:hypothetical protein BU23DRAFT_131953 [Bimuria novae-zelandiae CBS 107.79]|uniref:Uncharacterized protein n=1 Tax=Bimuria novae-zelandiae CBS 107.79 TaxID=1447943 RepID=A0A6A5VBY2_9PLEO|nr:hypothetical protein BU23DRAFT_131953 [Bimuria novae-zelandiae CBS 107.79]